MLGTTLITAINLIAQILIYLLVARAVCSWFVRGGGTGYKIYLILTRLTEPVVAPCRKITQRFRTGMFDISILLAFLFIMIIRDVLVRLIMTIMQ